MDLLETSKLQIEMILGRKVLPEEQGNIDSFADFSDQDKKDFEALRDENVVLEFTYIRFRLKHSANTRVISSYNLEVIQHGMDAKRWEEEYLRPRGKEE